MHSKIGRVLLLALLFSTVSFSYVIATAGSRATTDRATQAAPALAPLDFTNPFIAGDRDLGDAVPGDNFKRFMRGRGGIPPYKFTAGTLAPALFLGKGGLFSTPPVNKVRPPLPPASPLGPYRFLTTVTCRGTTDTHTEPFRLTVVNENRFRFAIGPGLNDAVQFRKYADKIDMLNPARPLTYKLVGNVLLDGAIQPSLASLGLAITKKEGHIFGQPLKSGTITFTLSCTDKNGNVALARDGSGPNQTFTINVAPNKVVSTDTLCNKIKVKTGKNGTNITYTGFLNINGNLASLKGKPCSVRLGNYSSPEAYFDTDGTASNLKTKNGKITAGGDDTIVKAKVTANGLLTITVTNADLSVTDAFEVPLRSFRNRRSIVPFDDSLSGRSTVVGGDVGDTTIEQSVAVSSSSSSSLTLDGETSAAGAFLVIDTVSGRDDKTGAGDTWRVKIVANPPSGADFSQAATAQVSIGGLANTFAVAAGSSTVFAHVKTDSTTRNSIKNFSISAKSLKGTITTTPLDSTVTGIPVSGAAFSGTNPDFSTQLVLSDSAGNQIYSGSAAVTIFPKKNAWTSTAPK